MKAANPGFPEMHSLPRPLLRILLLSLAGLAGCSLLNSEGDERHPGRTGFSVRVDGPGLPAAAVVVQDLGAYAQGHGFSRDPAPPPPAVDPVTHAPLSAAPDRYLAEGITLEVSRQPAEHRVTAYLRGTGPERGHNYLTTFYRDFRQEYAGKYGGADRFAENAYSDESTNPRPAEGSPGLLPPLHL